MLQVSYISEHKAEVVAGLQKKHFENAEQAVEQVLALDAQRREAQTARDGAQAEANQLSKQIGALMKEGKKEEAEAAKSRSSELKELVKQLDTKEGELAEQLQQLLYQIPNVPYAAVPEGRVAEDNVVASEEGAIPALPADALPHWDLIAKYDIVDFELGNKVAGAGFPFYKGKGAKLQRALINFFLDEAEQAGYREIQPPVLINEASGYGTGQFPDKEGQMYHIEGHDLYLIPTAEVPITNMYRDVILSEEQLPQKVAGYTPCFRREAGSWGAHVRGLNRLHQFDKVEIVQVCRPEDSAQAHLDMVAHVEGLLRKLELPFRKLLLCGGDMSFNAAICYDMEVFSAAQQRWLEVSSISSFDNFQANRLKLRFRDSKDGGKMKLLHTLNGSALALPRILAALLENNQTPEGIRIPEVLQKYTGFAIID